MAAALVVLLGLRMGLFVRLFVILGLRVVLLRLRMRLLRVSLCLRVSLLRVLLVGRTLVVGLGHGSVVVDRKSVV